MLNVFMEYFPPVMGQWWSCAFPSNGASIDFIVLRRKRKANGMKGVNLMNTKKPPGNTLLGRLRKIMERW